MELADTGGMIHKLAIIIVALAIASVLYAFGSAITNGDYFGACDGVRGQECRVVHILGVVMHRDVPEEDP
jgi:hypothetical protein